MVWYGMVRYRIVSYGIVISYHIISVIYSAPVTKWIQTIGAQQKSYAKTQKSTNVTKLDSNSVIQAVSET